MRTKSNKSKANSTKLIDIPSLITVWLQVRGPLEHQSNQRIVERAAWITAPDTSQFREIPEAYQ
jgi:hypothetical protein